MDGWMDWHANINTISCKYYWSAYSVIACVCLLWLYWETFILADVYMKVKNIFISPEITAKVTCTWPRELSHPWVITTFRKVTFINEIYIADTQWWWKSAASDILGVTLRTINTYANLYNPANCLFFHLPWLSFSPFHYCQSLSFSHTCVSPFPEICFLCCSVYSGAWNNTPTIHKHSKAVKRKFSLVSFFSPSFSLVFFS